MTQWVGKAVVLALHEELLSEHGGPPGVRDEGLLDSALARPINRANYGSPDIFDLAASYAFGIARDHPFVDGNKRVSLVVTELFLDMNGYALVASDFDCLTRWLDLAAGSSTEVDMADWLRNNCKPTPTV